MRRLVAIPLVGAALTLIAFGIVRGTSTSGPARGVRLRVEIEPPVDGAAFAMAEHVVRGRLDEKGVETRVVRGGAYLVVELGNADPELASQAAGILERTATLEVRPVDPANPWLAKIASFAAGDPQAAAAGVRTEAGMLIADERWDDLPIAEADGLDCIGRVEDGKRHCRRRLGADLLEAYVTGLAARDPALSTPGDRIVAYGRLDGGLAWRPYVLERETTLDRNVIKSVRMARTGVAIGVATAAALQRLELGSSVAFLLDGRVTNVGVLDRVAGPELYVTTAGSNEDAAIRAAFNLVAVIEAGCVRPLHVRDRQPFTRATGFLPRAWPFLAIGAVLLIVAAALALRRGEATAASARP